MTATISAGNGAGTTTPLTVVAPYVATWESRNVIHDLISGGIAVSLVEPRPRSGTLTLLYDTEESAFACTTLHLEVTTFTLTEDDRPSVSMAYVTDGEARIELDKDTQYLWLVTIGFQEVIP